MANNRLELQVTVDESGAIKGLTAIEVKAKESAGKIRGEIEGAGGGFNKFAESVKRGIEDPLGTAGEAAKGFLTTLGPIGVGIAGAATAMGALAAVGFEAAKSLGEYGDALEDTATRMGLTVKETAQFSFAMKYAGGDISSLEGSMRMLSQGLNESTEDGKKAKEGLKALGIEARDSNGHLRPMSQIFVELSEKLGGIEDVAKRNTIAIQVLGRAGLQVLPDLLELSEGVKRANEIGIKGPSPEELKKWKDYHHQVVEFETEWERLKRQVKDPLAATLVITTKLANGALTAGSLPGAFISALFSNKGESAPPDTPNVQAGFMGPVPDVGDIARINSSEYTKQRADAILKRWGMTKEGLEYALSQAKKNEKEALDKLNSGEATSDTIDAFQKAQREVSSLEAKIKGLADAQTQAAKVLELTRKYSDTAQDPLRKLFQDIAADTKGLGAGRDQVERAGLGAILRETAKIRQKEAEEAGKAAKEMSDAFDKVDATIHEMMGKATGFGTAAGSDSTTSMMRVLGDMTPGAPRMASAEQRVSSITAAEQAQERIVQLLTGPGGEVEALKTVSAMRRDLAAQEMQIMSEKITNDLTLTQVEREKELFDLRVSNAEKIAQIERDYAIQTLELRKRQEDDYVNAVKGGFQALISGGRSGLGSFIGSQAMGLGTTVVGNLARMSYGSVANSGFGFSQDSLMGKLFAGTPFVKAGDVAMNAAQIQYKAATVFANAVTAGSPGNVIPGVPFGGVIGAVPGLSNTTSRGGFGSGFGYGMMNGIGALPVVFGNDASVSTGPGRATTASALGLTSRSGRIGAGVGVASDALAGGYMIYQQAQAGSTKGVVSASLATAAALDPEPISKAVLAIGATLVSIFGGDPKKAYADREASMLNSARYTAPDSTSYTYDQSGRAFDYDYRGNMRTYITVNNNVSAMDSGDVSKFFDKHGDSIADTIRRAIPSNGGLRNQIQAAVNP